MQKQFGEFERYSHTPQIGRDEAPKLEDSLADVIARDIEQTMTTTGLISGLYDQEDDKYAATYGQSTKSKTHEKVLMSSSLPTVKKNSSNVNTNKIRNTRGPGKGGKGKGKKGVAKSLAMGGLRLDDKLRQELEELAMVAQATNAMMSSSMPAIGKSTSTSNRNTAEMRTNRSDMTRVASTAKTRVKSGASNPPSRFRGDSRGSSGLHIFSRELDNGTFTPSSLEVGLGPTTPHSMKRSLNSRSRSNTAQSSRSVRSEKANEYKVESSDDEGEVSKVNTPTAGEEGGGGGDVYWEGFDQSGEIWLAFSQVSEMIPVQEKVAVRVWSMTGEGTGNTIISKLEMEQFMLQPMQWMNGLHVTEMTEIIERLIECLLSKKDNAVSFQFLSLPRKNKHGNGTGNQKKEKLHKSSTPSNVIKADAKSKSFGSSPVPPLVIPDRSRTKRGGVHSEEDDESSRLHTPQPLTSHSTSSAVLEISYLPSKASNGSQKRSVLYYEQPPKPVSGSLYAADGSFAYGSGFSSSQNKSRKGSANGSSRANSVLGNGSGDGDSSPRTSLWSGSTMNAASSTAGSAHSNLQRHNSTQSKDTAPWENSRSMSYPEEDKEWVDQDESLKPYVSSDEEDVEDFSEERKEFKGINSLNDLSQVDNQVSQSKQTLETAEKVRATLMRSEIDAAYEASDCSLLMELLAIARTMNGTAAIHVLTRILDLLKNQDKQEAEEKRRMQLTKYEKSGIQQSTVNESIRDRFGALPPQQHLRELLADASCMESCIETLLAFPTHWHVQIAVVRTLTALITGIGRLVLVLKFPSM